ncbi:MAG: hypothetical protein ABIH21_00695 [Patescibacteria group bacterium]
MLLDEPTACAKEAKMEIMDQSWEQGGEVERPTFEAFDTQGQMLDETETVGSSFSKAENDDICLHLEGVSEGVAVLVWQGKRFVVQAQMSADGVANIVIGPERVESQA